MNIIPPFYLLLCAMFRHKRLLHFRKIKHICFMKKINFRILTLNNIRSQPQYTAFKDFQKLTEEQRKIIRESNPEYPPTLFMTQEQKQAYFEEMDRKFKNLMESSQPRVSKTKKIVKFIGKIEHFYDPNEQIIQNIVSQQE